MTKHTSTRSSDYLIFLISWLFLTQSLHAQENSQRVRFTTESLTPLGGDWQIEENHLQVEGSPAKLLVSEKTWSDLAFTAQVKAGPNSQAGLIFRVNHAGPALDQYDGYYIGIDTARNSIIWGAVNHSWNEIAQKVAATSSNQWYTIRVIASGKQIQAWVLDEEGTSVRFPVFDGRDESHRTGRIGVRTLGGSAEFRNLSVGTAPPRFSGPSYINPVQENIADPAILKDGGRYYVYATHSADHPLMKRGIRLFSSQNLTQWQDHGFVIQEEQSWGSSRFWAPDIIKKDGHYYLYYATDTRICVAKSNHPMGPFVEWKGSPIEPESVRIDAHVFQDGDQTYFYYVRFNQGNEIWGGELNDDMVTIKQETLRLMIRPDQPWERHQAAIVEGPVILKHDGLYYLTYSGSHFESPHYAVGYATSKSPLGPWKKYAHNPVMKSTAYAHGTAHHCFTTSPDGKEHFILYHQHRDLTHTEPRQMAIDRVQFVSQKEGPDLLEIHGPTNSPQPLPSGVK